MNGKSPSGEQRICSGFSDPVGCSTQVAGKAHAVVLRGWRAGELLSEERMGRTREACGMLLVQLMGKGRGSVVPPRLPILSPPSHLCCADKMCIE